MMVGRLVILVCPLEDALNRVNREVEHVAFRIILEQRGNKQGQEIMLEEQSMELLELKTLEIEGHQVNDLIASSDVACQE